MGRAILKGCRGGIRSFHASHPQRHHLPVPVHAQSVFPHHQGSSRSEVVEQVSRVPGPAPGVCQRAQCCGAPVTCLCVDIKKSKAPSYLSKDVVELRIRALLPRSKYGTLGRMFRMTETPQEGRERSVAALPLAKSAADRNLRACLFWDVAVFPSSLRASSYKCFSFSARVAMAATVRRQRPRRLLCWTLVAILLADLLALSGMYLAKESKE